MTLLLADVEGSTRLWENQPKEMPAATAPLDRKLTDPIVTYRRVRLVEQGEGESFVVAFARASDAVACAFELQRARRGAIRLRIGVHTGEAQLRGEGNYIACIALICTDSSAERLLTWGKAAEASARADPGQLIIRRAVAEELPPRFDRQGRRSRSWST